MPKDRPSRPYHIILALSAAFIAHGVIRLFSTRLDKWAEQAPWLDYVLVSILGFCILYFAVYVFFLIPPGKKIYAWWQGIKPEFTSSEFWKSKKYVPGVFSAEDRTTEIYKKRIIDNIETSKIMYFSLLSGHTMFFDETETFIINKIKKLPADELKTKDIRFQLMDRNQHLFKKRGEWFIKEMNEKRYPYRVTTYTEYLRRCDEIEREISQISSNIKVDYYKDFPVWRYFIFDKELFVSIYQPTIEGHLSMVYRIRKISEDSKKELYWGFYDCFTSLYKQWTEKTI
jgi:hypothetical protein